MKHFSPRLKELAVRQFKSGESIDYLATLYETTREKLEAAIRAHLIEQEHWTKVFDGHEKGDYTQARGILPVGPNEELPEVRIRKTRDDEN